MAQGLRDLIASVGGVQKQVSKGQSVQVKSQKQKGSLQDLVDCYFREVRPSFISHAASSDFVEEVDCEMQDLLECSHRLTTRSVVKKKLSTIKKKLIRLDSHSVALVATGSNTEATNMVDRRVIETLKLLAPSAALSYEQSLIDLDGPDRKSWRGQATDLREALRETLDHLAPDKDVKAQPGFKLEPDVKGPTMKQKTRFILLKRGMSKTYSDTSERAVNAIETAMGSFVRSVYTRSSISTHTPTNRNEVLRIRDLVRVVLCELLEIR
jgi:hypothetical protein